MKQTHQSSDDPPPIVGWREWVGLPTLGIPRVKAKIDTGARSSSLHAINIESEERDGVDWVRFEVHPLQRKFGQTVQCEARVLDYREIRSSSGHSDRRPVILTEVELHGLTWSIELTLADRSEMGFRMLLGREGVRGRYLVDPGRSYFDRSRVPKKSKKKRRSEEDTTSPTVPDGGSPPDTDGSSEPTRTESP